MLVRRLATVRRGRAADTTLRLVRVVGGRSVHGRGQGPAAAGQLAQRCPSVTTGCGVTWQAEARAATGTPAPSERAPLPPAARHIGHALASVANSETGRVEMSVSLAWLADSTGLSRSSVKKFLNELESTGFVRRRRSKNPARDHEATVYTTTIPAGFPTAKARPSRGQGLGRESVKARPSHGPSTTSTNADAGTALRASGATGTNPESAPLSPAAGCECPGPPPRDRDDECVVCARRSA